jgi:hypothetical protein
MEMHNKEERNRERRAEWLLNRTEHLMADKYDFDLKRRKKAYLQVSSSSYDMHVSSSSYDFDLKRRKKA